MVVKKLKFRLQLYVYYNLCMICNNIVFVVNNLHLSSMEGLISSYFSVNSSVQKHPWTLNKYFSAKSMHPKAADCHMELR